MRQQRLLRRGPKGNIIGGKSQRFAQPINLGTVQSPAVLEAYWHPDRPGVVACDESFGTRLREMHDDLRCCRPPDSAPLANGPAWVVWYKRERITHRLSPGWMMLFAWRNDQGVPMPLDERVFAVLYESSALKWKTGKQYFDRAIEQKLADEKAVREKDFDNHRKAKQREFIKSTRITNIGDGSRFSNHHDGTIAPSRGQLVWHLERRRRILPPELIQAEDEAAERQREALSKPLKLG